MTLLALWLVLASAMLHAIWNLLAKRVAGGLAFVWLFSLISLLAYTPLAIATIVLQTPTLGLRQIGFMLGSGLLQLAYFIFLSLGYRAGDLSLVYPLSRSSGPALAILGAVFLLDETLTLSIIAGSALILAGIFVLTGNPLRLWQSSSRPTLIYALLIGFTIAGYSLWDKVAVSHVLIPPLLLDWSTNWLRIIGLSQHAHRHRHEVQHYWQNHRFETLGIAILGSLSYILLLTALKFSQVSIIVSLRQISIVLGTWLGTSLLSEAQARRRLLASAIMLMGVLALALA